MGIRGKIFWPTFLSLLVIMGIITTCGMFRSSAQMLGMDDDKDRLGHKTDESIKLTKPQEPVVSTTSHETLNSRNEGPDIISATPGDIPKGLFDGPKMTFDEWFSFNNKERDFWIIVEMETDLFDYTPNRTNCLTARKRLTDTFGKKIDVISERIYDFECEIDPIIKVKWGETEGYIRWDHLAKKHSLEAMSVTKRFLFRSLFNGEGGEASNKIWVVDFIDKKITPVSQIDTFTWGGGVNWSDDGKYVVVNRIYQCPQEDEYTIRDKLQRNIPIRVPHWKGWEKEGRQGFVDLVELQTQRKLSVLGVHPVFAGNKVIFSKNFDDNGGYILPRIGMINLDAFKYEDVFVLPENYDFDGEGQEQGEGATETEDLEVNTLLTNNILNLVQKSLADTSCLAQYQNMTNKISVKAMISSCLKGLSTEESAKISDILKKEETNPRAQRIYGFTGYEFDNDAVAICKKTGVVSQECRCYKNKYRFSIDDAGTLIEKKKL